MKNKILHNQVLTNLGTTFVILAAVAVIFSRRILDFDELPAAITSGEEQTLLQVGKILGGASP